MVLRINIYTLVVFMLNVSIIHSQQNDTVTVNLPVYYTSLKDKLSLYLYGINKFNAFEMKDSEKENLIQFKPNENFNLGLGFNYKWAGIGAAFNFGFVNKDNDIYGDTRSIDLQVDLYTSRMVLFLSLSGYEGFYWQNVDDYYSGWSIKDSVIIRPDISTFNFSSGAIYTFNHKKFSFRAAYGNTEWQKHSAGSMLAAAYFSLYAVSADSSLVPDILQTTYPLFDSLTNLATFNLGGSFGYTHTFVIKKHVFINGTLMIGVSMQAFTAKDFLDNVLESKIKPSTHSHLRLALGYNSEKSYFGISLIVDSYLARNEMNSEFTRNYGKFRVFYGRRFTVSKSH